MNTRFDSLSMNTVIRFAESASGAGRYKFSKLEGSCVHRSGMSNTIVKVVFSASRRNAEHDSKPSWWSGQQQVECTERDFQQQQS